MIQNTIGCTACVKKCPAQAVSMEDNRIVIDHKLCLEYGPSCEEVCVEKCPRDILRCLRPSMTQSDSEAA